MRRKFSTDSAWEHYGSYSRAVQVGNMIAVAGTVAADSNNQVIGIGNPYAQTLYILSKIEYSLNHMDSKLSDIFRTRIYIKDPSHAEYVLKAHGEVFREILPAATLIVISELISPQYLVEIEADAYLDSKDSKENS